MRIRLALLVLLPLLACPVLLRAEDDRLDNATVTLHFEDIDVRSAIAMLAEPYGLNVILHEDVQGQVSGEFNEVPLRKALDMIAQQAGLEILEEDHGILRVVVARDEVQTATYRFRRFRPEDEARDLEFIQALRTLLAREGGDIVYSAADNAVQMKGSRRAIEAVTMVLEAIDRRGARAHQERMAEYEKRLAEAKTETAAGYFVEKLEALEVAGD